MDLELRGKAVLVTGAARGIGRAIALDLAREGARVALHYYRSAAEAEQLAARIRSDGGEVLLARADLSDEEQVDAMFRSIEDRWGRLDGIVNNAGGAARMARFLDLPADAWRRALDEMVLGVVHVCRRGIPLLLKAGGGSVVSLAGDSARVGDSRLHLAAAARGAVVSLTRGLAREYGQHQIRFNVVSLGLVKTHALGDLKPELMERIVRKYPLGRIGTPEDVSPAVLLLLSPRSSWITGQVLSINGGSAMPG